MSRESKGITLPARFEPHFWDEADGRCALVKEIRRRVVLLETDTGADSAQKRLLCQRAVFVAVQLESMERVAAEGGSLDFGVYTQATNALVGLLKALGLEKKLKSVHDLNGYLKERKRA